MVIPRERKERSVDMDTVLHHIHVPFQLALVAAEFPHLPVGKNISHETIAPGPPFGKFPLVSTPAFSSCGTRGSFVALPILEHCSGMASAGRRTLSSAGKAWHVLHIATAYLKKIKKERRFWCRVSVSPIVFDEPADCLKELQVLLCNCHRRK